MKYLKYLFVVGYFLNFNTILFSQDRKELSKYLTENSLSLDSEIPNFEQLLPDQFYQNNVYLLGERHGIAYSYDVLFKYVKHLKEKLNFKYYILETPFYWEDNLNKYFETGNEKFLKKPFQEASGTFYANQDFYDYYKKLYQFNKSLPSLDRIHFLSIDVEHQYKYSHAMLLDLLKKYKNVKLNGSDFIDFFYDNDPEKNLEYEKTYKIYKQKWIKDSENLKPFFGKDFETTDYLIRNINFKFIANADSKDLARDSLMFLNFKYKCQNINIRKEKFFGFMGIDHCFIGSTPKYKYFGAYLTQNSIKTTSTIMLYSNSKTLIPNHYLPKLLRFLGGIDGYFTTKFRSNDRIFEKQRKIKFLKRATQKNKTLFRLNQKVSPFNQHAIFIDNLKTKIPTTKFMHYVILIKKSPAASILDHSKVKIVNKSVLNHSKLFLPISLGVFFKLAFLNSNQLKPEIEMKKK